MLWIFVFSSSASSADKVLRYLLINLTFFGCFVLGLLPPAPLVFLNGAAALLLTTVLHKILNRDKGCTG